MADEATSDDNFRKFKDAATAASDRLESEAAALGDKMKERFGPTIDKVVQFTKERPATSILIALAAGMLLSRRR